MCKEFVPAKLLHALFPLIDFNMTTPKLKIKYVLNV